MLRCLAEHLTMTNSHYSKPFQLALVFALMVGRILARAEDVVPAEKADVVVYGGTSGGVIAAVQVGRMGKKVLLVEPSKHLGGLTSGGLGATDYGRKESIGGLSREFYQRVKKYYAAPAKWRFSKPEDLWRYDPTEKEMWYFEPHVAEQIFGDMLREAGVKVVLGERLDLKRGVKKTDARITSITMESGREFQGAIFIDATYEGDLMAKAGVGYHVGREANSVYGETVNGVQPATASVSGSDFFYPVDPYVKPGDPSSGLLPGIQPDPLPPKGSGDRGVQAYNFRLALTDVPGNKVEFEKPADYDPAKYELMLRYLLLAGSDRVFPHFPNPGPLEHPGLGFDPNRVIMPNRKTDQNTKGAVSSDYVGMNWDYPEGDYAVRERIIREHESYHRGMLWFLANDLRVPAAYREPMRKWGLAKDEFADNRNWPHQIYVREARRMIGEYVVTEHDCRGDRVANDSIGLGSYGTDSHFIRRYVDTNGWVQNEGHMGGKVPQPYPISYRALTPKRGECENLLVPVCLSASHVAYGSIRMEPVYMILGQSAGAAAVLAIKQRVSVQEVNYAKLRPELVAVGQRLAWPLENVR